MVYLALIKARLLHSKGTQYQISFSYIFNRHVFGSGFGVRSLSDLDTRETEEGDGATVENPAVRSAGKVKDTSPWAVLTARNRCISPLIDIISNLVILARRRILETTLHLSLSLLRAILSLEPSVRIV